MRRLILRRLALAVPILIGVSIAAFVLMRLLPGDFALAAAGSDGASPEVLDNIRQRLGLDRPIWKQYLLWVGGALQGDFGTSFLTRRPVTSEILPRLGVTFQLTLIASIMAMILGGTTGLLAARFRGTCDWVVRLFNGFMLAIPSFVIGTLIVLLAGLYFPSIGLFGFTYFFDDPVKSVTQMLLPAFALALSISVTISENTRAAVLEVAGQDYVMVARAKGLRPSTVLRNYLVKNALTPVITVTGLQIAALLGGSIIIETIFSIPGMGQYLYDSITARDYPVIQAIVLITALIVVVVNILVDIAYTRADARVSL